MPEYLCRFAMRKEEGQGAQAPPTPRTVLEAKRKEEDEERRERRKKKTEEEE